METRRQDRCGSVRRQLIAFAAAWLLSAGAVVAFAFSLIRAHSPGNIPLAFILSAFALQFALFWLPGFPAIRGRIEAMRHSPAFIGVALLLPYLVYVIATRAWSPAAAAKEIGMIAAVLGVYGLFRPKSESLSWQDVLVMLVVAVPVYAGWYREIWGYPVPLYVMGQLFAVSLGAFGILSVRRLSGVGYEWRLARADWVTGVKQLALYAAVGIPLGLLLHFIGWHPKDVGPAIVSSFVTIFLFVGVPEELFFRGMLQNLLEKSLTNQYAARAIASVIFGLSHIHHGFPNWRYVIMATVAGWFYGTAWNARRSIVASAVTHAAVDTLWRHFLTI